MPFASDTLCTAGLAAFAAAVFGGGFYLLTYRPYAKKRESERAVRAAAARAGGSRHLGHGRRVTLMRHPQRDHTQPSKATPDR
jgi:hypothetical protein